MLCISLILRLDVDEIWEKVKKWYSERPDENQGNRTEVWNNQNQNCLLVIRPKKYIHQDLSLGELVPSPHKRRKLSN